MLLLQSGTYNSIVLANVMHSKDLKDLRHLRGLKDLMNLKIHSKYVKLRVRVQGSLLIIPEEARGDNIVPEGNRIVDNFVSKDALGDKVVPKDGGLYMICRVAYDVYEVILLLYDVV